MIIDVVVPIATKKRAEIFKLNDFSFLLIFKSIVGRPPLLWVYQLIDKENEMSFFVFEIFFEECFSMSNQLRISPSILNIREVVNNFIFSLSSCISVHGLFSQLDQLKFLNLSSSTPPTTSFRNSDTNIEKVHAEKRPTTKLSFWSKVIIH